MAEQPLIYKALAAAIGEMDGVAKAQRNKEQGYMFRGLDDITKAARPVLSKHGICVEPIVLDRIDSIRQTGGGKTMYVVNLQVQYSFYAADGSSIRCITWGEGTDFGDKATNKAMSAAFKYALLQTLVVSDSDEDADHTTQPESAPTNQTVHDQERRVHQPHGADVAWDEACDRAGLPEDPCYRRRVIKQILKIDLYADTPLTPQQYARCLGLLPSYAQAVAKRGKKPGEEFAPDDIAKMAEVTPKEAANAGPEDRA